MMSHRIPVADIQFIADFAAFCRGKGGERYVFEDERGCACAQFLSASGRAVKPVMALTGWREASSSSRIATLPEQLWEGSERGGILSVRPNTFSALADRLEALIADAPMVLS